MFTIKVSFFEGTYESLDYYMNQGFAKRMTQNVTMY